MDEHLPPQQVSAGRHALESLAPHASAALRGLESAAWHALADSGRAPLGALAAQVVATQHGLAPLAPPARVRAEAGDSPVDAGDWRRIPGLGDDDRTALGFAEQMSFDVASLQDDERAALFRALGPAAAPFVQAVYVADFVPRTRAALDALFGATPSWSGESAEDDDPPGLQPAFDELIRVVPRLQALDPVTTELVRLLGARRHRCRLCQSLRSRSALAAGADEALFEAVDHYATSSLDEAQKAALAFADAMIGPPARIAPETAAGLRASHGPAACVELVLDVTRNATNKVAVALGADAPHVESGVEIYDVGPDGELEFGLEAP